MSGWSNYKGRIGTGLNAFVLALALLFPIVAGAEDLPPPVNPTRSAIISEDANAWDMFQRGGWCMWPILGCAIIGLIFSAERLIELRKKKHAPGGFDKDLVHLVDTRGVDAGLALCLEKQSSLSRVLYAALLRYGTSRQEMEAAVHDESTRLLYDLRRNCRWIGVMSSLTPLLGMLGTVIGLIQSFDAIGGVGARSEALTSGVAVALLSTAFGLIAAIPLLLLYHYNKHSADDIVREISERAIDAIVTLDRKARRSIRLIEDIEEHLETQEMAAARTPSPDLDLELDDDDRAVKSSVTTPAQISADGVRKAGSSHELKAGSSNPGTGAVGRKEGSSASKPGAEKRP